MKNILLIPVLFLLLSKGSFSQTNEAGLKSIVMNALTDENQNDEWKMPKSYYGKHIGFKDSLMMMILENKENEIINKICQSQGFVSVLLVRGKNTERLTAAESIKEAIIEFRKSLPSNMDIKPSVVNEELYYEELTRHEIWHFNDINCNPQKIIVQFVEGTITNILLTMD